MRKLLEEAFLILDGYEAKEQAGKEKMLERLKERAAEIGHKQLAAELGVDRGNLSAMLAGRRLLKPSVLDAQQKFRFGFRYHFLIS